MSTRQWKLLLVDDAEDLHAITKLAAAKQTVA